MAKNITINDYPYHPKNRNGTTPRAETAISSIVAKNEAMSAALLKAANNYHEYFERIPVQGDPSGTQPYWTNGWLPPLDGISIYTILATRNPKTYMEVGSGNSTKFARQAIIDHNLQTKIVSIDPCPRASIDSICDEVIRSPLEDVPIASFDQLGENDVLFVDNSHRAFQNSDVTVFFTEILPLLAPGVVYGLHDIFIPYDYPADWTDRYYNEQYLLHAYLLGGMGGDEILLPSAYVAWGSTNPEVREAHTQLFSIPRLSQTERHGAGFWLIKGTASL